MEDRKIFDQLSKHKHFFSKFYEYALVKTAINIGLFELLYENFLSVDEIINVSGIKSAKRNVLDFLDKLYTTNYLEREGSQGDYNYKTKSDIYVKSNPYNLIYNLLHGFEVMKGLFDLEKNMLEENQENYHNTLKEEDAYLLQYSNLTEYKRNLHKIENLIDFTKYKSLLDYSTGMGEFTYELKRKYNNLKLTNLEFSSLYEITRDYINLNDLSVDLIKHDILKEGIPSNDVIIMHNKLKYFNEEDKVKIFRKVNSSLNANGIFIIIEDFIDNEREKQSKGIDSSVTLIPTGGFNLSASEIERYSIECGFSHIKELCEGTIACFK